MLVFKKIRYNIKKGGFMAQRRMISKNIYDSDKFLDLPATTQLLYTHLVVRADDDGFIGNVRRLLLMLPCTEVDLNILIKAGYLIPFETGVCVVTDWRQFNKVPKSRYSQTVYLDELNSLSLGPNKKYLVPVKKH